MKNHNCLTTIIITILFCSCSYGTDDPFNNSIILSPEEFSKKMELYDTIFANTISVTKPLDMVISEETDIDGTTVIPVPERVAIVQTRRAEKIRLETTGLCACVGVVGWNTNYIGCIHWDLGQDKQDLKRFADDLTNNKEFLNETAFLFVTNFFSARLESMYQFLRNYAPSCPIYLEAEYYHGGYVIMDDQLHKWFHNAQDQNKQFDTQTPKRKPFKLKSVSIKSQFSEGEIPYTFTATKPAKHIQEYFIHLDSPAFSGLYQNPRDFWHKYYPLKKDREPEMLWIVAEKLYLDFIARRANNSPQQLIYLYDSKEHLPKVH